MTKENWFKRSIRQMRLWGLRSFRFITLDMWRLSPDEIPQPFRLIANTIKVLYMATKSFIFDDLMSRAASLTYSTVLSIVPMLAVIVGIAKGFGLQAVVHDALVEAFPGQEDQLSQVFVYVENYLEQVQGGLFIGFGLIVLLYTVLMLIASIEDALNSIWQAPHSRPWSRRILDYFGFFLLLPILLTGSSVVTLLGTAVRNMVSPDVMIISSVMEFSLNLIPYIFSIASLVALYMLLPNVRVRFVPALISGTLAGIAFQIFQSLYISGVLWISRYNAIYGSFAAFPLLLLWMQLSWTITLFGAQLCYSIQNIRRFSFGEASLKASRRYFDFVTILVASKIIQRFGQEGAKPYRAESLSSECQIPLRLVGQVLARLEEIGVINEIGYGDPIEEGYYHPAVDPELISVGYLVEKLDRHGFEDFRVDNEEDYRPQWEAMLITRQGYEQPQAGILLRDLKHS